MEHAGGMGSRLHKTFEGTWLAYAQWPDRERWEQASVTTAEAQKAMDLMADAVEERLPHIELTPVADLLVQAQTS